MDCAIFRNVNYDSCKVYPAGYDGVINAGATDMNDNTLMGEFDGRDQSTNLGSCVDMSAPGNNILSIVTYVSLTPPATTLQLVMEMNVVNV